MKKPVNLMFVSEVHKEPDGVNLGLKAVGDPSSCVNIIIHAPAHIANSLVGLQVFVEGGWGDICRIVGWPTPPCITEGSPS
ncbi:MAG TPA: hypothetical protein DHV74_02430 [Sulfitobacter sp.]|jgi:hypothetical protein|nr:hypothetical protein [Sulfitobacter sp.]